MMAKINSFIALVFIISSCSSGKYVDYLSDNTESIPLVDTLHFSSLDEDFYANQLFFVGEIHEVATSPRIDFAMFSQINENAQVDVYMAEIDLAQAYYLKKYLQGSDDLTLKEILAECPVYIGRVSEQYRDKWVKMRQYYETLSDTEKFDVVGVDGIADFMLLKKLISEKLPRQYSENIPEEEAAWVEWSANELPAIIKATQSSLLPEDVLLLENIQFNLSNYEKIRSRDKFMYENFKRYYQQNNWHNKRIYACFGFAHTLQAYTYTFAGRIKKDSTLVHADKMVSMNALYVNSRLTVQSRALPRFMQDKGQEFTRFKFSYDSRVVMYIKGIADYKKVTEPNTISLMKLDQEGSPYTQSLRGTKTSRLIPIWDGFDILEGTVTTDYAQYIFLVRNADWIIPDDN